MSKIYKENYHRESKYGLKETNSLYRYSFLQRLVHVLQLARLSMNDSPL